MKILHYYRSPGISSEHRKTLLIRAKQEVSDKILNLQTEYCFNVETTLPLSAEKRALLVWLLGETFEPGRIGEVSFLPGGKGVFEVGPRLSFNTAWCTNAVAICQSCGLSQIKRIERSRRYFLKVGSPLTGSEREGFLDLVHDRMTEYPYLTPLASFESGITPEETFEVPIFEEGRKALERINREAGLAFDDWDLDYYTDLFLNEIGRNPTNVECFDIAQSNSEHSRHWFFKGRLVIDGQEVPRTLLHLVQEPLRQSSNNSTIAFEDNSSSIRGCRVRTILPSDPRKSSPFVAGDQDLDITFTAETHNFPSGVAPFPGAETGTGGRIRDGHATGRGSLVVAGTAAYCVGNLHIPGYPLPWEDPSFGYPANLASPLEIEIEASNGASDYGNKFGEPVILGYTRSFGMRLPDGERREWIKPIMFSGGVGQIDARHRVKQNPREPMLVVKIGGPAYRIGMGGGAASSMVQGENVAELDFNAVQRGDAEMEQKVNRVIRACVELGDQNPVISIHDQGAGGNCNVLKEIVSPAGARIEARRIILGDSTLSVLEIWGAEYQEQDALLLNLKDRSLFETLCEREKVPVAFVGEITGDGRIVLFDSSDGSTPVDLELDKVLGTMPQKVFTSDRIRGQQHPLRLPEGLTIDDALQRVLRLLSVGSKRFLTNKVDRSVTGLVARQQCAGPLQVTVSDVAVIAQSHFATSGAATAIGEQPIVGLINPAAMARMCVAEALTNLVWAEVTALEDVKCSGNWMWAAKLPGEGAAIYDAAVALRTVLIDLGIAIDGGKDSLSMAALAPAGEDREETVKAPGSLVISAYVTCPDVRKTVTPDLKLPDEGTILFVDLGGGKHRLGGSALAHVYGQVGEDCPDLDDSMLLKHAFETTQELIKQRTISAGHDRSDGGLITTLLEMAFAGNCGIDLEFKGTGVKRDRILPYLFCEESGLVIEVATEFANEVISQYRALDVPCIAIGRTVSRKTATLSLGGEIIWKEDIRKMRDLWEETSYQLELLQANPECVEEERTSLRDRTGPQLKVAFTPEATPAVILRRDSKPKVAIVREEGSNGDREMVSAFFAAGFEPWDVTMSDLLAGRAALKDFRGVVFVGGFSFADVLDSAKGWSGVIRFNESLRNQFEEFYQRPDSFSLGVCNGCQLAALLGWVPWPGIPDAKRPRFIQNRSGRFESRFSTVRIEKSPALMLKGMEGSALGIWVAHGEGKAYFPEESIFSTVKTKNLAPIRFVDDQGRITEKYPFNPNGSPDGIAGLCSTDGRHLAMMPHPERAFLKWQWGWIPEEWKSSMKASPWLKMFQNARVWCERFETE